MKKRPLCAILLIFLFIQSVILIMINGQTLVKVPASSIFFEAEEMEYVVVEGQVYQKEIKDNYQILYLKDRSITNQEQIMVYEDTFQDIKIGQKIKIRGMVRLFQEPRNPGSFDAKIYYAKQKIYGTVWCTEILSVSGRESQLREGLFQIRQNWKRQLLESMGKEKGGILCAMLLNEKGEISTELKELYQSNGYGHILAISGLHISFVGMGCYRILRKIGCNYSIAGGISIGVLTLYVLMLGFSVSIFRAFLMLFLRIGADITGRSYDMLTSVTLSAAILVWYEPLYLVDAAFQLSHGAIYALMIVCPEIKRLLGREGKMMAAFSASLGVQITLLPIILWWYYEVPVCGIIWNVLVIPLMSIVMTMGMAGSILPFKDIWLMFCSFIFELFELLGKIGSAIPGNRLILGRPAVLAIVLFYLWLFLFVLSSRKKKDCKKWYIVSFLCVCLLFFKPPTGEVKITMLDVGQGDCIYIEGPDGTDYMIDGGSSDVKQVGKYRIEPFLECQGVGRLEYVFISHGDTDHYNGVEEMLTRQNYGVRIQNLVLPETYKLDEKLVSLAKTAVRNGTSILYMKQGSGLEKHGLKIQCLQPGPDDTDLEGNAGSLVLDVSYGKFSMLFTGDVETEGEERLIHNLQREQYSVLKVAHHGSKNSTSQSFLDKVKPQIALISAGEKSIYGHPHEETLERLQGANAKVFITSLEGAIALKTDGNTLTF